MTLAKRITYVQRYIKDHRWVDFVLLGLLVAGIALANGIWIRAEGRPPHWDMARHLWTSLNYQDIFKSGNVSNLIEAYYYYPPLIYWVANIFYAIFGTSAIIAVTSNIVFIAIGGFATYGTGRTLWGRKTGLLSAVFLLCSPMMVTQFKEFQIDAPLTAMVCLALYLLVRCRDFVSTRYSLLLGLVLGLGMLTKWTFGFIMVAPLGLAIALGIYRSWKAKSWSTLQNILLCLLLAYAVASLWYIVNKLQIRVDLTQNGVSAGLREGDPLVGSFSSNIWYVWNLLSRQLYLLPFLSFILGLAFLTRAKVLIKNRYPIALVVGTFLAFTLLQNKDARYTLPALAGVTILATYWIGLLKSHLLRWSAGSAVITYSLLTFALISSGASWLPQEVSIQNRELPITLYAQHGYIIGKATSENWQLEEAFIKTAQKAVDRRKLYYSGPDSIWFNSWDLAYYSKLYGVTLVGSKNEATTLLLRSQPGQHLTASLREAGTLYHLPDEGELVYVDK